MGHLKNMNREWQRSSRCLCSSNTGVKEIAGQILTALEEWAKELQHTSCILETGKKQPEAIRLYQKSGYNIIPNYGQYAGIDNSVCMKKEI